MEKLIIDPEFKGQIPEPTSEELAQLEQNLIEHGGARDPLVSWRGILLDGHNRLEICTRLDLPYQVIELDLADRQAAEDWIDRNQLGRRNLNPDTASLLRGRIYNRMKKAHGGDRKSNRQNVGLITATQLATDYGVTSRTIERDGQFARAVEDLKKADPTIEQQVHSGKVAKQSVVAAAKVMGNPEAAANPETARRAAELIRPSLSLPVAAKVDSTKSDSITLDAWKKLTQKQQETVLARNDSSGFNAQDNDSIEWAQWSWNPITGCDHNCPYCYARDIAERFAGTTAFPAGFSPALRPGRLTAPRHQKFPEGKDTVFHAYKNVFTGSMADIFGRWVPEEWIQKIIDEIRAAPKWNFLMLTKFPARMAEFDLPKNLWAGTSVDCQARVANAEKSFAKINAKVKWLSIEPMIEPLKFTKLDMFQWVVLGGASRSTKTPAWSPPVPWVVAIEAECNRLGVAYYEKSNLFTHSPRIRMFPGGIENSDAMFAPAALQYLPPKTQFIG